MNYSLQALFQVLIPFLVVIIPFVAIYAFSIIVKGQSIREHLRENLQFVISIISTLLVFVTLLEMQTERVQAYKPFIVLGTGTGGCTFEINDGDNSDRQYAIFCSNYSDETLSGDVAIPIKNIGVGVAKNVQMKFSIDYHANTNSYLWFENHYPAFSLKEYANRNERIVDQHYMEQNTFLDACDIDTSDRQLHYQSFILPNNQETLLLRLPVDYLSAVRHYFSFCHRIDVPPLYLMISYEDVQGVKYTQKFLLSLSMQFVSKNESDEYTLYYSFTPEEGKTVQYGESSTDEVPIEYNYKVSNISENISYETRMG